MDIKKKNNFFKSFTVILSIFIFISCIPESSGIDPYYITGSEEEKKNLTELFNLLKTEESGSNDEFAITREIAASFARVKDYERLIHFLSAKTINNPADPYNGYYFLMIAYAYIQRESEPIAALYFDLIIINYPDLIINDESIHLICLRHLIDLNNKAERQVWYYNELISRFSDKIDLGTAYFMLGQACESAGNWNGAIAAYSNYLPFTGTIIPGFPQADQYAKNQVDFSRSQKDWTFESVDALRSAIEEALDNGDVIALMGYQTKVNFFARSWEQAETEDIGMRRFNLAQFMYGNRIKYFPEFDTSNSTEAFLKTTGWALSLNTWYLYFRKIYFPQDPDIHGRWEWAGIYYGEKF
jgi:tetratricopeptide (TPR) repeat protein